MRLTDHRLWLARGDNWPDALAAGAAIAENGGTLLLANPTDLYLAGPRRTGWPITATTSTTVYLLGGTAASGTVVDQMRQRIAAGPTPSRPRQPLVGEILATYDFETDGQGWTSSGQRPGPVDAASARGRARPRPGASSPTSRATSDARVAGDRPARWHR